jgi:molybdopterin-containing oxidoreductase family iron-sulfur binding subunit
VHSADGLNDMVYNRCVGTRFCSNNCPYKVRRFNFLAYSDYQTPSRRLQYNPDVTVRTRGVMEKCTYCVQRIRSAEMDAEAGRRPIRDGDVLTACQAVCPTQAIVFGDLNDSESEIARRKQSPLEYGLLAELNTYPRTTYLAALQNPNPDLQVQNDA